MTATEETTMRNRTDKIRATVVPSPTQVQVAQLRRAYALLENDADTTLARAIVGGVLRCMEPPHVTPEM